MGARPGRCHASVRVRPDRPGASVVTHAAASGWPHPRGSTGARPRLPAACALVSLALWGCDRAPKAPPRSDHPVAAVNHAGLPLPAPAPAALARWPQVPAAGTPPRELFVDLTLGVGVPAEATTAVADAAAPMAHLGVRITGEQNLRRHGRESLWRTSGHELVGISPELARTRLLAPLRTMIARYGAGPPGSVAVVVLQDLAPGRSVASASLPELVGLALSPDALAAVGLEAWVPLLWPGAGAFGRPVVLLSWRQLAALHPVERARSVAHELAHLRGLTHAQMAEIPALQRVAGARRTPQE